MSLLIASWLLSQANLPLAKQRNLTRLDWSNRRWSILSILYLYMLMLSATLGHRMKTLV